MEKQYIFLTGKYMPKPGATGVCMHALAKYLAQRGENVTTICYDDGFQEKNIDGVKIERVNAPSYFFDKHYESKIEQIRDVWASRLMKLIHIRKYPLRSIRLLNDFVEKCFQIIKDPENTVVIASYTPLEAVAALEQIKRRMPNVKTIYYSADTLSNEQGNNGILSAKKRRKLGFEWEKRIFDISDLIFIMECHGEHYFSEAYRAYWNKMKEVNFPLLNEPLSNVEISDKRIIYAGTLLKGLRNPQFACDSLVCALKNSEYEAVFMGSGDCNDILEDACEKSNGKVSYLGMQPYDVAEKYIQSAKVLLSIGNAQSPMAPSKIYEYMATGKPIIHFYSWEGDSCLEPLSKYGNSLIIKNNDEQAVEKIKDFIVNSKQLKYMDVAEIFKLATPEYTVSLMSFLS